MSPPCDRYVSGYGDANADFHVIGDHPGIHGGIESGVPFTGKPWSMDFLQTLLDGGLLIDDDPSAPAVAGTFISYLHTCVPEHEAPKLDEYGDMERFFDAELRAIAAHVLLPVGERATAHVFDTYTARGGGESLDMRSLHANEFHGSGWLILPIADPATWKDGEGEELVASLTALRAMDYRQESDLGRFIAGGEPYFVR